MLNKLCLFFVSTLSVVTPLQTKGVGVHYVPFGPEGIWIDVKNTNKSDTDKAGRLQKQPQLALESINTIKTIARTGPKCFACSGTQCASPRLTGHSAALQCDYGDVCWTIETIEVSPDPQSVYFRGCGPLDAQKCAGERQLRAPARSTAGQRKDANGPEYCDWSARISQCKSCCVNDYCNGARLFQGLSNEALDELRNSAPPSFGWVGFDGLLSRSTCEGSIRRCCFVAVVWWITLLLAFPPWSA